jgi:hypothetical protein
VISAPALKPHKKSRRFGPNGVLPRVFGIWDTERYHNPKSLRMDDHAERHVDQEDRAPGGAGDIRADQQPARDLAGDRGDAGGRAVQGQGPRCAAPS